MKELTIESGRTLVLGTGYVAGAYMRALHFLGLRPMAQSRDWLNYTDPDELRFFLKIQKPQLVINAAGYTGGTVDDCEVWKDVCYAANVAFVRNLGTICRDLDISMFHVSSGCIFEGPGPFTEESQPNNLGQFYAQCKAHAETELAAIGGRVWVFRIRMPFGPRVHHRNWLCKLAGYDRILDGLNSVTFIDEFAMRSYHLAQKVAPGVFHAACSKPVSTAAVARMLFDAGVRTKAVEPFPYQDFIAAGHVHRSAAVLDVSKFERAYGAPFGDPEVSLRWCIDRIKTKVRDAGCQP